VQEFRQAPAGFIHPVTDGEVTSYFEWLGAGLYRPDPRSGAMHGRQFLVREIYYGTDGTSVFLRLDFETIPKDITGGIELRMRFVPRDGVEPLTVIVKVEDGAAKATLSDMKVAMQQLLEIEVPLRAIQAEPGVLLRFQISLWQGGLPLGTLPHEGWLQLATAEPVDWAG
jgi:hypothetical protein